MIKKPTTLVLGAGASYPYGFPLADELLRKVVKLRRQPAAAEAVALAANVERLDVADFCTTLAASQAPSVDTFLEANMDLSNTGRAAMAQVLLGCSKGEFIGLVHAELEKHGRWYRRLWARLIEDAPTPEKFMENQLSVVTFNYDLSLEAFLFQSIKAYYRRDLDAEAALRLLNDTIAIVHAYGTLSPVTLESLDWHPTEPETGQPMITQALEHMLILPDIEAAASESLIKAKELLSNSHRVASIGFSFGKANVQRLTYFSEERRNTKIELSFFKLGKGEREMAAQLVHTNWAKGSNEVVSYEELNGDQFLSEIYPLS